MCGCLTFSSKAAGFRISSLTILTGWEKCARRNTSQILGLRKNCSLFCKSWFSFLCSEKKESLVTQVLLKSFETILSATNHYLILLKGLLGRICIGTTGAFILHEQNSCEAAAHLCSSPDPPPGHLCSVRGTGARGGQMLRVWWRQEHSPSRINCSLVVIKAPENALSMAWIRELQVEF